MKLRLSRYFAAILGLAIIAGIGVAIHSTGTPVASADGFGRTEVTFTKWVNGFPNLVGISGGDVGNGTFAGTVITRDPTLGNGQITKITAEYRFMGSTHSSVASVHVWQFGTSFSVINGAVTSGWKQGATVYGMYRVIPCAEAPSGTCFQGRLFFAGGAP
jgi:hypothetical protein